MRRIGIVVYTHRHIVYLGVGSELNIISSQDLDNSQVEDGEPFSGLSRAADLVDLGRLDTSEYLEKLDFSKFLQFFVPRTGCKLFH